MQRIQQPGAFLASAMSSERTMNARLHPAGFGAG
jgi:hypothetical protein